MTIMHDSSNKRLSQFEILRILAMFGVLMNHVFNYGLHIYDDFTIDTSTWTGFIAWSIYLFIVGGYIKRYVDKTVLSRQKTYV